MVVVLLILLGARLVTAERSPSSVPLPRPLAEFPLALDQWSGADAPEFDAATVRVLNADDYLNRIYEHPVHGPAGVFVAYYGSQQHGEAIHSPQNCLPGSGWVPVAHSRIPLQEPEANILINRYVVERRGARQLVLYWFQGRGRVIANEYVNKGYLFRDALFRGRSEGALVRVVVPIVGSQAAADAAAHAAALSLLTPLNGWLP
jgi:EpsI family protein